MKLLEKYLPRKVFDQYVLLPVGQEIINTVEIIHINETGYIMAQNIVEYEDYDAILAALAIEFEASEDEIPALKESFDAFLELLAKKNITIS